MIEKISSYLSPRDKLSLRQTSRNIKKSMPPRSNAEKKCLYEDKYKKCTETYKQHCSKIDRNKDEFNIYSNVLDLVTNRMYNLSRFIHMRRLYDYGEFGNYKRELRPIRKHNIFICDILMCLMDYSHHLVHISRPDDSVGKFNYICSIIDEINTILDLLTETTTTDNDMIAFIRNKKNTLYSPGFESFLRSVLSEYDSDDNGDDNILYAENAADDPIVPDPSVPAHPWVH